MFQTTNQDISSLECFSPFTNEVMTRWWASFRIPKAETTQRFLMHPGWHQLAQLLKMAHLYIYR